MTNSTKLRAAKRLMISSNGGELFLFQGVKSRKAIINAAEKLYDFRSTSNVDWVAPELSSLF
jgi:hypothetical protein